MDIQKLNIKGTDCGKRPLVIAGPCSAESREQVLKTAVGLVAQGIRIFRAGVWKPRTKPGGFEGVGAIAIPWLKEVKEKTGMLLATEVATPAHVPEVVKGGVDLVWIGARTVTNPFAMQELADSLRGADIPILVKNPVNPDIELWAGALERLYNAGVKNLGVIHRGFSSGEKKLYRNIPHWSIPIELRRRFPNLTIFCDPSHIGGSRELIAPLSQQSMDLSFDGLMIESHCFPDAALSDAAQQVTPDALGFILKHLIIRENAVVTEDLESWRANIDELDEELLTLLAKRMGVSRKIGKYKKEHGMPVLQSRRYNQLLSNCSDVGKKLELNESFVKRIMKIIHEESVKLQLDL